MLRGLKEKLKIQYREFQALKIAYTKPEEIKTSKNKLAFVMLAANYDNLGDIAITRAQQEYLQRVLPADYEIVVIPHDKTFRVYLSMKKAINHDTIITLIGGGNSGTLYEFIEWPRRFILRHFSDCKIISFPQSVFFEDGKYDDKYKHEFIRLSLRCKSLTLVAREKISYSKYKEMLGDKVKVLLVPDIVFTLKEESSMDRAGVCFIFRNDKEKAISVANEETMVSALKEVYDEISYADTCDVKISGTGYEDLKLFIDNIKTKKLVVTDRLHGMILAYITNTPCIALDNNNHKIKSTYETWLLNDGKVRLFEDGNDPKLMVFTEERVGLDEMFEPLKRALLEENYDR